MVTCKDCIYRVMCYKHEHYGYEDNQMCEIFKNKADFVEVVRCPDCVYCKNMKCTELKDNSGHSLDVATFDYCSQGVRKEKNDFKE